MVWITDLTPTKMLETPREFEDMRLADESRNPASSMSPTTHRPIALRVLAVALLHVCRGGRGAGPLVPWVTVNYQTRVIDGQADPFNLGGGGLG